MDKSAQIEIDVKGAERAAAAARGALQPFADYANKAQSAFKSFRGEVASAVGGVVSDLGKVITVGSSISFAGAVQGVQSFEKAVSQLSVATGRDVESIEKRIGDLGQALSAKPEQIANYLNSVGKQTYNFDYAEKSLGAFAKFARETGRELTETSGLAGAFKRMGIEDADKALQQLRGTAQGTVGGVAALADQVTALSGAFLKSSTGAQQLFSMTAAFGKGLGPAQAQSVQSEIMGSLDHNAQLAEVHLRRKGLLGKGQHIVDPLTGKVNTLLEAQLLQRDFAGLSPEQRLRRSRAFFGSTMAAAQFFNANLGGAAGEKDTDALERYAATPGGEEDADEALRERNLQRYLGHGSFLGGLRKQFRHFSAGNPLAGMGAEYGTAAAFGWFGRTLIPRLLGVGKAAAAGGEAAGAGSGGGGLLSFLTGGGLGYGAAGAAGAAASLLGLGYATAPLNQAMPEVRGGLERQFRTARSGRARALIRAAERSGGSEEGFIREVGPALMAQTEHDPALKNLFEQLRAGNEKLSGLGNIGEDVAKALKGSPLAIQVVNYSDSLISVEQQPGGDQ